MAFVGKDWRSPGNQWIRTEFGWRPLSDIRKNFSIQIVNQFRHLTPSRSSISSCETKTSPDAGTESTHSGKVSPMACHYVHEEQNLTAKRPSESRRDIQASNYKCSVDDKVKKLSSLLTMRCIYVGRSSSESNQYSTISDAVQKLNFQQALRDENCFPFICRVIIVIFEEYYQSVSGSLQATLFRIIEIAKEIAVETRLHSGLVLKMIDKAVTAYEKVRRAQLSGFSLHNKIKSLLKMKQLLRESQLESYVRFKGEILTNTEFLHLPDDCLQHIISYLSNPRDVLNLGQTNMRLNYLTKQNAVWRNLMCYHYGSNNSPESSEMDTSWINIFSKYYKQSWGQLKEERSFAVCICKTCSYMFWKSYGHPCSVKAVRAVATRHSTGFTPQDFVKIFN